MKKRFPYLLLIFLIPKILVLSGCANMIPPSGGPRDSIPPVLLNASPVDSTRNFSGSKIIFTFNEFVELNNIQENLIVSPVPAIQPIVESHLRTITVRIKDTLQPNTTYSLNFGKAIRDINEGNELKNFTYVFSTGNYFDSLELTGKVIVAETGKPDSTLIVLLHRSLDDSAIVNERPRYFTKVDSNGNYHFKNLPPGTFRLYALKDEGGSKRYQSKKQLFGFADQPIQISRSNPAVTLYAYNEPEETKPAVAAPAGRAPIKAIQDCLEAEWPAKH